MDSYILSKARLFLWNQRLNGLTDELGLLAAELEEVHFAVHSSLVVFVVLDCLGQQAGARKEGTEDGAVGPLDGGCVERVRLLLAQFHDLVDEWVGQEVAHLVLEPREPQGLGGQHQVGGHGEAKDGDHQFSVHGCWAYKLLVVNC